MPMPAVRTSGEGRWRSRAWGLVLLLGAVGAGCSFVLSFDPAGLPCPCAEGFACVEGSCRRVQGGAACGGCGPGQRCQIATGTCVEDTCAVRRCPAGQVCSESEGAPRCKDIRSPGLGFLCIDDNQCANTGANRFCYRGAVQQPAAGGALRPGVCVERCPAPKAACLTPGAVCRAFPLGVDAGTTHLCLPWDVLGPCVNDLGCADDNLVCTVFDHPVLGPATVCDAPLRVGVPVGRACVLSTVTSPGGSLCRNGLCVPRTAAAGQSQTCAEPCDVDTCPSGQTCALVEFSLRGVVRHLPMCVASPTRCASCDAAASCGPDAPRCAPLAGGGRCLAGCSADGGGFPVCPPEYACGTAGGGLHCVPEGGSCL